MTAQLEMTVLLEYLTLQEKSDPQLNCYIILFSFYLYKYNFEAKLHVLILCIRQIT